MSSRAVLAVDHLEALAVISRNIGYWNLSSSLCCWRLLLLVLLEPSFLASPCMVCSICSKMGCVFWSSRTCLISCRNCRGSSSKACASGLDQVKYSIKGTREGWMVRVLSSLSSSSVLFSCTVLLVSWHVVVIDVKVHCAITLGATLWLSSVPNAVRDLTCRAGRRDGFSGRPRQASKRLASGFGFFHQHIRKGKVIITKTSKERLLLVRF